MGEEAPEHLRGAHAAYIGSVRFGLGSCQLVRPDGTPPARHAPSKDRFCRAAKSAVSSSLSTAWATPYPS